MAALDIPCPKCGRLLRLPDRALLGRKGRCAKCGHRFILQEPEKIEFAEARPSPGEYLHVASRGEMQTGNDDAVVDIGPHLVPECRTASAKLHEEPATASEQWSEPSRLGGPSPAVGDFALPSAQIE